MKMTMAPVKPVDDKTRIKQLEYELLMKDGVIEKLSTKVNKATLIMDSFIEKSKTSYAQSVKSDLVQSLNTCIDNFQEFVDFINKPIKTNYTGVCSKTTTNSPLKMMQYFANHDLNIADSARELCISSITAHQHLAKARRDLGVNTTHGAIKVLMIEGLIYYE